MLRQLAPLWAALSPVLIALVLTSCGAGPGHGVKIKGSDTVLPIAQRLAEAYDSSVVDAVDVSVTGGGSGVGIAALLAGTTDLAMASREVKFSERFKLIDAGQPYQKRAIAYDALALVVHPDNPVKQLTREQLEAVYTGQVTNWKALGGHDEAIVVYSRESSSGTHEFFKEVVLHDREFAPNVLMMPATGAIIQSVSQTSGAIGYVGIAYLNASVTALSVSYDKGATYVAPTLVNAGSRLYPIVRPLYFVYLDARRAKVDPFLRYAFSAAGQYEILKLGFVPAAADTSTDSGVAAPSHP